MAIPADLMAALQGGVAPAPGGPPAPPAQGTLPGDLVQALQGAGPPQMPPEAPGGRPSVTDGAPGGGQDPLTGAIDLIQEAIDAESDQEDIQTMLQCQAKLQQILAKNQSEADSALQGKTTPKAARKMAAGAGGGGSY